MKPLVYFTAILLLLLSLTCGSGQNDQSAEPVTVDAYAVSRTDSLVQVEFTFKMRKNVHIFSDSSRSFEIKVVDAAGLRPPSLRLPPSKRIKTADGTKTDTYSGIVKIMLTCPVTSLPWKMRGYVLYQACDESQCYFPTKKWFSFTSAPGDSAVKTLPDTEPDAKTTSAPGGMGTISADSTAPVAR